MKLRRTLPAPSARKRKKPNSDRLAKAQSPPKPKTEKLRFFGHFSRGKSVNAVNSTSVFVTVSVTLRVLIVPCTINDWYRNVYQWYPFYQGDN
jgi:hypothetical protein